MYLGVIYFSKTFYLLKCIANMFSDIYKYVKDAWVSFPQLHQKGMSDI